MALTRVQFQNINTNLTAFSDPLTITNFGNVGNRDIGEIFDRSQGGAANVAIIWQESTKSFKLGYTSDTGKTAANITFTGNANLRVGNLYAESISWANGSAFVSAQPGVGTSGQLQYNNAGSFGSATGLTTDGAGTLNAITVQAATIGNTGATLTGTISTAAQTNITSVGTLTGLTLSGTLNGNTIQAAVIGNVGSGHIGSNVTAINSFQGPVGVYGANTGSFTTTTTTGNATASALTVNGTATVGSTLSASGGLQNTAIGNLTQNSGTFTTLQAYAGLNNTPIGNATASTGQFTTVIMNPGTSSANASILSITGNAYGRGGSGYNDFLSVTNQFTGNTNPTKWFRLDSTGTLQIINSAYTTNIFNLTDAGALTIPSSGTFGNLITTNGVFWSNGTAYSSGGGGTFNGGTITGALTISNSTTSTSTSTGALIVTGGAGIAGNLWADQIYASNNGNGTNFRVGDDIWLGDINIANTMRLTGAQDGTQAYIVFGNSNALSLGRSGTGALTYQGAFTVQGGITNTPIGNATASTGQFTTLSATGNITGAALTSNGSITAVTTISGLGGLQATPIGNVTPSSALFTTVGASGNATVSALTVNGAATIGSTLGVTANIVTTGNIYSNNRIGFTYSANTTSAAYQIYNSTTNSIDTIFG